jgi:ubiquitin conjugation factor E4 B
VVQNQADDSKPLGCAEFLPILLALNASTLSSTELLPFLNDLSGSFGQSNEMADVITPTLSLLFQEWFKITPTPDLLGSEWKQYLGAMNTMAQVKGIAASVSCTYLHQLKQTQLPTLPIWVAPGVTAPKVEWQSLLGPLSRLSVFPREFVSREEQ